MSAGGKSVALGPVVAAGRIRSALGEARAAVDVDKVGVDDVPRSLGGVQPGAVVGGESGAQGLPIEIAAGDWVTFRRGFLCTWVVTEPIAKRYAYFTAEGEEM